MLALTSYSLLEIILVDCKMRRKKTRWKVQGLDHYEIKSAVPSMVIGMDCIALRLAPFTDIYQTRPTIETRVPTLEHNSHNGMIAFTCHSIECNPVNSHKGHLFHSSAQASLLVFPVSVSIILDELDSNLPYHRLVYIPSFITVILSISMYSYENSNFYLPRVYFITQVIVLTLFVYPSCLLLHQYRDSPPTMLVCLPDYNSPGPPTVRPVQTTSKSRPAVSYGRAHLHSSITQPARQASTTGQHWLGLTFVTSMSVQLRLLLTIIIVMQLPGGLHLTGAVSTSRLSRTNNDRLALFTVELENYGVLPLGRRSTNFHTESLPRPYPCMYQFRDDGETSALLADFVIVGTLSENYRSERGNLYNVSILVTDFLKGPQNIIFPVRVDHLVRVGQFSRHPDLNRCWIDLEDKQRYMFFIRHPDWSGYCEVSQLPLLYNDGLYHRVKNILQKGKTPLNMSILDAMQPLQVQEGASLLLTCKVSGLPTPRVTWFHNETQIRALWRPSSSRGIRQNTSDLLELKIDATTLQDSGIYTCLAENYFEQTRQSASVIVRPITVPDREKPQGDPCLDYCYQGQCFVVDDMAFCRCNKYYFGDRCELHVPLPRRARMRRPKKTLRAKHRKENWIL